MSSVKVHEDFRCYEREDLAYSHPYLECGLARPSTEISAVEL